MHNWNDELCTGVLFSNVKELRDAIHRYIIVHSKEFAKPFIWTKRAQSKRKP